MVSFADNQTSRTDGVLRTFKCFKIWLLMWRRCNSADRPSRLYEKDIRNILGDSCFGGVPSVNRGRLGFRLAGLQVERVCERGLEQGFWIASFSLNQLLQKHPAADALEAHAN